MQQLLIVALLFVARVSGEEVSGVQPVVGQPPLQQGQVVSVVHSAVEGQPPQVHQHGAGQVSHYAAGPVPEPQPQQVQPQVHPQPQHQYAPTGVIHVVGPQQYSSGVPVAPGSGSNSNSVEQYGKPESASIPPNYKPFGSWGLYIGGNPADGYYSSYYKALGSSVADKQQVSSVEPMKAVGGASPVLRQAVSGSQYPFGAGSYAEQVYPFDYYTPADLNSGSRVAVVEQPSVYAASGAMMATPPSSPVQVGSQVYGYAAEQPMLAYAPDQYATKRLGGGSSQSVVSAKGAERTHQAHQQQQMQQQQMHQQQLESAKGYQQAQARYVQYAAPAQYQHYYSAQPQVVAYPVPVGSQIVGSQPGTEGGYQPYGVHGYTRYAVKPTVVSSSEQHYQHHSGVHSSPVSNFPVYKQQAQVQSVQQGGQHSSVYQPLSFYGYPLNQLHYSSGSVVPAFGSPSVSGSVSPMGVGSPSGVVSVGEHSHEHAPVVDGPQVVAASSEKSETTHSLEGAKPKENKRA